MGQERFVVVLRDAHGIVQSSIGSLASALSIGGNMRMDTVVVHGVIMDTVVTSIVLNQCIGEVRRHVVLVACVEERSLVVDLTIWRASELFEVSRCRRVANIMVKRVTLAFVCEGGHGWGALLRIGGDAEDDGGF